MVGTRDTDTDTDSNSRPADGFFKVEDILLTVGFGLMLAWHYLVLFSPIFGLAQELDPSRYLFDRQLALYISLAVSFSIIGIVSWRSKQNSGRLRPSAGFTYIVGVCAIIISGLCSAIPPSNIVLFIVAIVLLGATEAILMFLWLRWFVLRDNSHFLRSFAIYMMAGGALALLICCLQWPAASIAASIAPGLSAFILARAQGEFYRKNNAKTEDDETAAASASQSQAIETAPPSKYDKDAFHKRKTWNRRMNISVVVYALSFGLLQGSFAIAGITLLMVDNVVVLVGILVSGLIIYLVPKNLSRGTSIDVMHRYSLLLFVVGAVGVAWFDLGSAFLLVSQIAIMAGFNLFDFGVMAHGMNSDKNSSIGSVQVLEGGRPIVYTSLAVGLVLGFCIVNSTSQDYLANTLTMICGITIIALVATTLVPFYTLDGGILAVDHAPSMTNEELLGSALSATSQNAAEDDERSSDAEVIPADWVSPWRGACSQIAKLYQLSPRETEIFFLVAKGRNADYVQQKLVISTHTAKTHIANIYRKLEVHSSQELLDLVEAFRDAERRMAEADDELIG